MIFILTLRFVVIRCAKVCVSECCFFYSFLGAISLWCIKKSFIEKTEANRDQFNAAKRIDHPSVHPSVYPFVCSFPNHLAVHSNVKQPTNQPIPIKLTAANKKHSAHTDKFLLYMQYKSSTFCRLIQCRKKERGRTTGIRARLGFMIVFSESILSTHQKLYQQQKYTWVHESTYITIIFSCSFAVAADLTLS